MIFDLLHYTRHQVAGDTDFQRDIAIAKMRHKHGILDSRDTVADALGADLERRPDGFGAHALAGVSGQMQPGAFGEGEDVLKPEGRAALLAAADSVRHH